MDLKEQIKDDLKEAIKKREQARCSTLRFLLSSILAKEKEKRYKILKEKPELKGREFEKESVLTDEEIIEVVQREIKKRKEAILGFEKGKREDLIKKEKEEIEVLKKYLPEQLSEEELIEKIKQVINKVNAQGLKDMGKVMKELMPKIKGRADSSEASRIVREMLSF